MNHLTLMNLLRGVEKTIVYTFGNKEEATKFFAENGKNFSEQDGNLEIAEGSFNKVDHGFQKLVSTITKIPNSRELRLPLPIRSTNDGIEIERVKTPLKSSTIVGLDYNRKLFFLSKATTRIQMSVDQDKTGKNNHSGELTLNINIEKFIRNKDYRGLEKKLLERTEEIISSEHFKDQGETSLGSEGNFGKIAIDKESILNYV